jgi:hypothetical protein
MPQIALPDGPHLPGRGIGIDAGTGSNAVRGDASAAEGELRATIPPHKGDRDERVYPELWCAGLRGKIQSGGAIESLPEHPHFPVGSVPGALAEARQPRMKAASETDVTMTEQNVFARGATFRVSGGRRSPALTRMPLAVRACDYVVREYAKKA